MTDTAALAIQAQQDGQLQRRPPRPRIGKWAGLRRSQGQRINAMRFASAFFSRRNRSIEAFRGFRPIGAEFTEGKAKALPMPTEATDTAGSGEATVTVHKTIAKADDTTEIHDVFHAGVDVEDKGNEWHEIVDHEMGSTSYFNWNTGATQWKKPDGYVPATPPALDSVGNTVLESAHSSEGCKLQSDRVLSICTFELTPAEALTESQLSNVYSSITTATPRIGGVVSWLGYETVPFAFGLNLMVIKCAVDSSGGSGSVACGELEALPAAQAVRLIDIQRLSIVSYGETEYWDQRYADENIDSYDWLVEWKQVRHVIQDFVGYNDLILQAGKYLQLPSTLQSISQHLYLCLFAHFTHVGCGDAPFSSDMYMDGYYNQINIDNAPNCIRQMADLHQHTCPKMEYATMDATSTDFEPGRFDCIIEKSLIDAILANASSGVAIVAKVVREMYRVLKAGGVYIVISLHEWSDISSHFRWSETIKFACVHTMLSRSGDENNGRDSCVCIAVCKKLPASATRDSMQAVAAELDIALRALQPVVVPSLSHGRP
jgi:SAM-dependent methyltransferase